MQRSKDTRQAQPGTEELRIAEKTVCPRSLRRASTFHPASINFWLIFDVGLTTLLCFACALANGKDIYDAHPWTWAVCAFDKTAQVGAYGLHGCEVKKKFIEPSWCTTYELKCFLWCSLWCFKMFWDLLSLFDCVKLRALFWTFHANRRYLCSIFLNSDDNFLLQNHTSSKACEKHLHSAH